MTIRVDASERMRRMSELSVTKGATTFLDEFRKFALKGNVIDLAVGVIIGAAFAKIVDSLVKHIIMPVVSILLPGNQSYLDWKFVVGGTEVPYGLFLGEVVNFAIVALALFVFIVKFLGWMARRRRVEEVALPPPAPQTSREEELLAEIRDLLSKQQART